MMNALTLTQLRRRMIDQRISASAVVDFYLARIEQLDGRYGAFVEVYGDEARERALALDRHISSGKQPGALHGIPIAIKDVIDIRGKRTGCGSGPWRTAQAHTHASVVKTLTEAGAIIIGKTHTVEFALGAWGTNTILGTPRNPWDQVERRAPGGSSSGSAVAVAAGLVPCALGTDTGGSIRVPAAWCGVSGLKVSIGSLDMEGVVPLSRTLDTVGPIARTVDDLALLWSVLTRSQPIYGSTAVSHEPVPLDMGELRFARLGDLDLSTVDNDVRSAYEASLELLQQHGSRVESIELAGSVADISKLNSTILFFESFALYGHLALDVKCALDEDVRARLLEGSTISHGEYLQALAQRQVLLKKLGDQLRQYAALLVPTTEIVAPKVQDIDQSSAPSLFTRFANFLGCCALALPNGASTTGLPTSLQIICPSGAEQNLLRIGSKYQSLTSWHKRRPA